MANHGPAGVDASWPERLSLWAYAALLRLATPAYLGRLWRRGAAEPLYRSHLAERLGFSSDAPHPGWVWVHAVSLGETRAAAPLIEALRRHRPGLRLLLTHGTATGREAGAALLRSGDKQAWLPYDTPGAVRRFLRHHQPSVGVLMETEIWPQLQAQAWRQGVPMVLANARLSERSARKGQRFHALLGPAARRLALALAQTQADAQRLQQAGVPQVEVMGNLKYDLRPDPDLLRQGQVLRERLGARSVVLAAVTREGEEADLLAAWRAGLAEFERALGHAPLLLIVPRHPQRFDEVQRLIEQHGFGCVRRSALSADGEAAAAALQSAAVCLGDTMREMPFYYGLADIALLGGSFAPLGGQNLIEAAACACPLLMGPHTFNFAEAAELALEAGAARRVTDLPDAVNHVQQLLGQDQALSLMKARAQEFAMAHRGAAERMALATLQLCHSAQD